MFDWPLKKKTKEAEKKPAFFQREMLVNSALIYFL